MLTTRTSYCDAPSGSAGEASGIPTVPSVTVTAALLAPVQSCGLLPPLPEESMNGWWSSSMQNCSFATMAPAPGSARMLIHSVSPSAILKRISPNAGVGTPGPESGLLTSGAQLQSAGTLSLQAIPSWFAEAGPVIRLTSRTVATARDAAAAMSSQLLVRRGDESGVLRGMNIVLLLGRYV
jgi:hypothetical protein